MQENEFEKQVQQKMDELKLTPSPAVWQKIEPQIKKEKRRRWVLILLPVLIASLYGGYKLINHTQQNTQYSQPEKKSVEKNKISQKIIPDSNSIAIFRQDSDKNADPNNTTQPAVHNPKTNNVSVPAKNIIAEIIIPKNKTGNKIIPISKSKSSPNIQIEKISQTTVLQSQGKVTDTTSTVQNENIYQQEIKIQEPEKIAREKNTAIENTATTPEKLIIDIDENDKESISKIDSSVKKIKSTYKYPWQYGLAFSTGISGRMNFAIGNGQKSYGGPQSLPPGTSGSGTFTPHAQNPSIAFITGFSIQKNISPKTIFFSGLNYKLFSTTNPVGSDSSSYYGNGYISTYHNYYHYIELPVAFKYQIAKGEKLKLHLSTGLSISRLISANALQFDYTRGMYYHDNSQFNKTQIGLNIGVDMEFVSKQKTSFFIGPYIDYSITKIGSNNYNQRQSTFIGLRTQIIFRKK